jgi:dolichyl-phosphate-mannose--protein O-mannosyl transferase
MQSTALPKTEHRAPFWILSGGQRLALSGVEGSTVNAQPGHELRDWRFAVMVMLVLGIVTRFAVFFGTRQPAMDEVQFTEYLSAYFTHRFYFDSHPPLGKLLVAGFVALFDFHPLAPVAPEGQDSVSQFIVSARALRFLPTLAGALLPAVVLLLARELGLTYRYAILAAGAVLYENALIAHARFVYFDDFLLLFGFASLLVLLRAIARPNVWMFMAAGALASMACAVKWTAMTFVALDGALLLSALPLFNVRHWCKYMLACVVPLIAVYVGIFAIHFALLPLPGPGDTFMPALHQKLLANEAHRSTQGMAPGFWQSLVDVHREMYLSNKRTTGGHPYGSKWYQWPWMWKPIYHLQVVMSKDRSADGHTYSMPNPIVWLGATLAVITACMVLGWQALKRKIDVTLAWLVAAYMINWLPFAGIARVMFLYHYYVALVFAILIFARLTQLANWRKLTIAYCVAVVVGFVLLCPFTYGLPTDVRWIDAGFLRSWR